MLIDFFFALRKAGLAVTITEYLALLEALQARLVSPSVDEFYYLARLVLIKDETRYDRYDRAFAGYMAGMESVPDPLTAQVPEEWLRRQAELLLDEKDKQQIRALGGWDALMETLKQRLSEQTSRHQGGSRWIGTAGTSPFGAYGYNPEGVRIGQDGSRNRRAVKVWDERRFRNLDDSAELGTRNIRVALRCLREFAREGAAETLDLDETIRSTARNGGHLDLKLVPERHNAVKVLLFFDVGGSMEDHVRICEQLFSAARSEFRHMEYFYFHNFVYETLWRDNARRNSERIPTFDLMNRFGADYKLIFVGDATMSPYEILYPGGSVEHWNQEPGEHWLRRLLSTYPDAIWLNPEPESRWPTTASIRLTRELMDGRMFPLTLQGLDTGIRLLRA